jgi:hypothetical protein
LSFSIDSSSAAFASSEFMCNSWRGDSLKKGYDMGFAKPLQITDEYRNGENVLGEAL